MRLSPAVVGRALLPHRRLASAARPVSLDAIKELRSRSGAAMAAVKDALVAEGGDVDAAAERLRREGSRLAALRTGRVAREGLVGLMRDPSSSAAALVELHCETDFVARTAAFHDALAAVARAALEMPPGAAVDARELAAVGGNDAMLANAAAVLGENVHLGRVALVRGDCVGGYVHGAVPRSEGAKAHGLQAGRIGVAVALGAGGDALQADRLALHVAAEAPLYLRRELVPPEVVDREVDILMDAARGEPVRSGGKPKADDILRRVVHGRLNKWLAEVVLEDQTMLTADAASKPVAVREWLGQTQLLSFARLAI
jgi:elongation factor Ts